MNKFLSTAALCLSFLAASCTSDVPVYKDASAPVEKRVRDLLSRMTLEEKIGQMNQYVGLEHIRTNEDRNKKPFYKDFPCDSVEAYASRGLIGAFLHVYTLEEANHLQELALSSRLGIPAIIGIDAVHGNAFAPDNTVYPTSIGLASTFDRDLVLKIGRQTALEMRAMGIHWAFGPGVDVSRDPRWGRCGETFGEDTYLSGEMGALTVKGLQGKLDTAAVLSTVKHLVGGGQSVNGTNASPTDISVQTLEEVFLPPFKKAVEAGAMCLMPAHNDINGIPCHCNRELIEGRVRGEWGFKGLVVSDWKDVERLANLHHSALDNKDAYRQAIEAGLDIHMHGVEWQSAVYELVKSGVISEKRIDQSVRRILDIKFRLGLFEHPFADPETTFNTRLCPEHRATALQAARESVVLLKNDGILPLSEGKYRRVLVTGINADSFNICGDWAAVPASENVTTILEGLRSVSPSTEFVYVDQGLRPKDMTQARIDEAAGAVKTCDLCIFVGGEFMNRNIGGLTCGENNDRADISLPGLQNELFDRLASSGKPMVMVLVTGRPLGIEKQAGESSAVLNAWEPGMYGGQAVAEILYGRVNPSGRLSMTIPRNSFQTVLTYNYKPLQTLHPYIDQSPRPLYPFGFGMSYTSYAFSDIELSSDEIPADGSLTASVTVTNTGSMAGDEVVQMYIRDEVASRTRPVKELKGFERVHLDPGESRRVEFTIGRPELEFYDARGQWSVEAGDFTVMIGGSSEDSDQLKAVFAVK